MVAIAEQSMAKSLCIGLAGFFFIAAMLTQDTVLTAFASLFVFRYYRLVVATVAYFFHRAVPVSPSPACNPHDVTAILPTVDPQNPECLKTIYSVLSSGVTCLIVVTPLDVLQKVDLLEHDDLASAYLDGRLRIECCFEEIDGRQRSVASKRRQVARGLEVLEKIGGASIVILVDDHVQWPVNFLPNVLAPFTNSHVGGVAMWKRVKRTGSLQSLSWSLICRLWQNICLLINGSQADSSVKLWHSINDIWLDFWNFIGCLYLERHNFDITGSHYVDKGVFVISGRTAAYRSEIICTSEFREAFCTESWLGVGPLNADDDNFITRWLINRGWQIGWQHGPEATIITTIGNTGFKKFNAQCLRWARTTWRSNATTLFADRVVLATHPWSVYAVYVTNFFNFALFTDSALLTLCWKCGFPPVYMLLWIFCSKLVKPLPHFLRHPRDLVYLPGYILFGYYHSMLKLYALFTVRNIAWGSRPGIV